MQVLIVPCLESISRISSRHKHYSSRGSLSMLATCRSQSNISLWFPGKGIQQLLVLLRLTFSKSNYKSNKSQTYQNRSILLLSCITKRQYLYIYYKLMISQLLRTLRYKVNVYEGISPSLLATMSLSVNIKGTTQAHLISNMVKANLISNDAEINAFKELDRQLFTTAKNPYQNKPYPISNHQNMTDIFTHAVIINNLSKYWRNNLRILDIGTGHGYLPFLIRSILEKRHFQEYKIKGIDIYQDSITFCRQLKEKLCPLDKRIQFENEDLTRYIEKIEDKSIDIVIGGYFLQQKVTESLMTKLSDQGVGIWPTRSQSGQALYLAEKNKQKVYIIETLFSMPVVNSSVSKYFHSQGEFKEEQKAQAAPVDTQLGLEQIKKIRKQMQQKLRQQLKLLIQKYGKVNGRLLTLKQMKENNQINAKLIQLQRLNKQKIKSKVK